MTIEAMKQALEALCNITNYEGLADARQTLRQAIAEAEKQEPVAWFYKDVDETGYEWKHLADNQADADKYLPHKVIPLYTSPPQRQPLTDEQRREIAFRWRDGNGTASEIIDMVETAHGIKE